MRVLIELPTWLGDSIMTSPAIENLVKHFDDVEITLMGSLISIETLKNHPKVVSTYILDKKLINLYKVIKKFEEFDFFITFRSSFRARILKYCIKSKRKYQFKKDKYNEGHQVEKYNNFVNDSLKMNTNPNRLVIYRKIEKKNKKNKLLGINPGAAYGNAKRWYPEKFADVASDLSSEYDIIIFGGPLEKNIANDIESCLINKGIDNYKNLAAQTSIKELISQISNLDLFITGDSGPMHLAAAFQVPTVSIFGPTRDSETAQWMNKKGVIVKKNLKCQPCMQRTCPLKHHNCMQFVQKEDILKAVKKFD
jgi:heptosyltransferase II